MATSDAYATEDGYIETLRKCEQLTEKQIRALCDKVRPFPPPRPLSQALHLCFAKEQSPWACHGQCPMYVSCHMMQSHRGTRRRRYGYWEWRRSQDYTPRAILVQRPCSFLGSPQAHCCPNSQCNLCPEGWRHDLTQCRSWVTFSPPHPSTPVPRRVGGNGGSTKLTARSKNGSKSSPLPLHDASRTHGSCCTAHQPTESYLSAWTR